jgi:hypothetical protein
MQQRAIAASSLPAPRTRTVRGPPGWWTTPQRPHGAGVRSPSTARVPRAQRAGRTAHFKLVGPDGGPSVQTTTTKSCFVEVLPTSRPVGELLN